jgi:hypothetical protein
LNLEKKPKSNNQIPGKKIIALLGVGSSKKSTTGKGIGKRLRVLGIHHKVNRSEKAKRNITTIALSCYKFPFASIIV